MPRGKLLVFEGADGIGKSRMSAEVGSYLRNSGIDCKNLSFPGNEPGTLGRLVYDIHHKPSDFSITNMPAVSLQTLHIAAHIDTIAGVISPALHNGSWVVLDRFWWSTWVYGRAEDVDTAPLELLIGVENFYWGDILPAAVFLITRDVPVRVEKSAQVFARLSALYTELAARERAHYPVWLIENRDFEQALSQVLAQIKSL